MDVNNYLIQLAQKQNRPMYNENTLNNTVLTDNKPLKKDPSIMTDNNGENWYEILIDDKIKTKDIREWFKNNTDIINDKFE